MKKADIQTGSLLTFGDHTKPDVWEVEQFNYESGEIKARNVSTRRGRTFHYLDKGLRAVGTVVTLTQDGDGLVGRQVKLTLRDGGMTKGLVTAIVYGTVKIGKADHVYVQAIQLDRSSMTTYKLFEIVSIV